MVSYPDTVFLPDLDFGGGFPESVLLKRDKHGQPIGCLANPPKSLRAWLPSLEKLQTAREAEADLDALCVLYVALTRAKEATFVILQKKAPRKASRARDWLLAGIGCSSDDADRVSVPSPWGEGELLWQHGVPELVSGKAGKTPVTPAPEEPLKLTPPVPRRERRKPSDAGHKLWLETTKAQTVDHSNTGGGLEFGTAVHEVFEQVEWWQPNQCLSGDQRAVDTVRKCLQEPEVQALFLPETPKDEVCRELPIELIEKNTWWSGIADRLVIRRNTDGSLRKAIVVDFKTDAVEDPARFQALYSDQLAVYRSALAAAMRLPVSQVETVLVSTYLRRVVTV